MAATAYVTKVPSASGAPTVAAGSTYDLIPVGNISLETTGVALGTATVSGTALGIDGPNWLLGYYGGQWLVHNGNLGAQPTYETFALDLSSGGSTTATSTTSTSSPPATTATTGFQISNGMLVIIGVGVLVAIGLVIYFTRGGGNGMRSGGGGYGRALYG